MTANQPNLVLLKCRGLYAWIVCASVFCSVSVPLLAARAQRNAWIAAWATSPQPVDPNPSEPLLKIENQTVRACARIYRRRSDPYSSF